jgi:uncharacterized protein (DUF3084 family)
MSEKLYTFTEDQLIKLMHGVIELNDEYKQKHGKVEEYAASFAAMDTIEGLDAELSLWMSGECNLTSQSGAYIDQGLKLLAQETAALAYKNDLHDAKAQIERMNQMIRVRDALLDGKNKAIADCEQAIYTNANRWATCAAELETARQACETALHFVEIRFGPGATVDMLKVQLRAAIAGKGEK